MFEWILLALAIIAAITFAALWRRERALAARADIERRAAERSHASGQREWQRHSAQLAAINLAQSDAVLLISPDRTLQQLNHAASLLFGPKAASGDSLMTATRSVELDELVAHVLAGGDDNDRQVTLHGLPFRARAIPAGEHGLAIVLKDQSELQRLGRARRDFIANISHELRTPITSIRLLVESLLSGIAREPQSLLQKVSTEVQALEQMAQELLDLAQIESGQTIVKLLPTPVDQLVNATVERLLPQANHKQLRVEIDVPHELIALADTDLISRALGNLLHNAIKFTPPNGHLHVNAQVVNGDILIKVSDSGPGISPIDLPRVFERFYRGDRSRKSGSGGTGLGLAIAKHAVEAHGGKIWVESDGTPGHGAIFSFTLLKSERHQPGKVQMTLPQQRVLFLCTHNSARSQMAEGLLRGLSNEEAAAFSAGTVATRVRPEAIAVMDELGIDISGQSSKTVEQFVNEPFEVVITVCDSANETCPFFPHGRTRWHWSIEDPSQVQGTDEDRRAAFRLARDELRRRIEAELLPHLRMASAKEPQNES